MRTTSSFSDYQPLGHLGRLPIHVTTIITMAFGVGLVLYALLASAGVAIVGLFGFHPVTFARGGFWTPLTYAFLNSPNFFSLLGLFCFYQWAMEVERYLGRARFLKLFVGLLLICPVLIAFWSWAGVVMLTPLVGNYALTAACLIAFATLYPNIEYFGWIPLKWFAFACVSIGSLMYFPGRDWIGLSLLLGSCGLAFGFIRWLQGGGSAEFGDLWEKINPFQRRPKFRVVTRPATRGRGEEDPAVDSIDPLLDKIARTGLESLTAKERNRLEKAREALLKKERP